MLIGEQTMPNLMPFLQMRTDDSTTKKIFNYRVILITTADSSININAAKIADFLLTYFPELLTPADIHECRVDSHNFADILAKCRQEIAGLQQEAATLGQELQLIFNMSSGTKIMGLATYPLAQENQPMSKLIYLDSNTNRILNLLPLAEPQTLSIALTVAQYTQAYGYKLVGKDLYLEQPQIDSTLKKSSAAQLLGQSDYRVVQRLLEIANKMNGQQTLNFQKEQDSDALELALQLDGLLWNVLEKSEAVDNNLSLRVEFLQDKLFFPGGKWLEQYIFDYICVLRQKSSGFAAVYDVIAGARLRQNNLHNEIDVLFTWGQHIALCSCKTGRAANSDWISELNERARSLGTFSRKVLICLCEPSEDFKNRAFETHITLISGKNLPSLANLLTELISPKS